MKRTHWLAIAFTLVLFGVLYWGFDKVPVEIREAEKSRLLTFNKVSPQQLERDAVEFLTAEQREYLISAQNAAQEAQTDSLRAKIYENLSSFWFQEDQRAIAGFYAQKIAEIKDEADAWGLAGTTYVLCIKKSEGDIKTYCRDKAVECMDNAISLEPEELSYKLNKALAYVNLPPEGNPMMGIQQILSINRENPDYIPALEQLARLGMQTSQWSKAEQRLKHILSLELNHRNANCMMVEVLQKQGKIENLAEYKARCSDK